MGGYERDPAPFGLDGIPDGFEAQLLTEDWDRFEELMAGALRRVPAIEHAEVKRFFNGPEAFTPDGEFILGESEVPGFWVAAGFCAHGLAGAGGIGKVMAEWIVDGEPEYDLWHMDIRRFGRHYRSQRYALARTTEVYSQYYDIHFPGQEREAGRPLRVSAAYPRLRELGAAFGEKSGWERANWFEPNAARGDESLRPRGWAGRNWSPAIGAECLATRDAAALFDESSFAKIDVHGPGALAFLDGLCANLIDRPIGSVVYTQLLNRRGGIECDLTVTRLADDRFQLVTGTAFGAHDLGWLRRHLPGDGTVYVDDVTASRACFGLWGPRSRAILQSLTKTDLAHEAFPYLRAREVSVGYVPCLALRVTYVGELGYELYCPTEYGLALWDALIAAGEPHGLVPAGYRAIDSLRLEKGYRAWSHRHHARDDARGRRTRLRGAHGQGVAVRRPRRAARRARLPADPAERLRCIALDDPSAVCLGGEPVRIDRETAGRVTTGGYGYRVERSIAYAYLPADAGPGVTVEIDIFGELVTGTVVAEPLYDPENARIRA